MSHSQTSPAAALAAAPTRIALALALSLAIAGTASATIHDLPNLLTTTPLAAGASFTGPVRTAMDGAGYACMGSSDAPGSVEISQSLDGGTTWFRGGAGLSTTDFSGVAFLTFTGPTGLFRCVLTNGSKAETILVLKDGFFASENNVFGR